MIRQGFNRQVAGLVLSTCFAFGGNTVHAARYQWNWKGVESRQPSVTIAADSRDAVLELHRLLNRQSQHPNVFTIRVELPATEPEDVPPVSGKWTAIPTGVKFTPEFSFTAGLTYSAAFHSPDGTTIVRSTKPIPKPQLKPQAFVEAVYPSSRVLPENLLKFYIHFSHPMSRGDVYRHITLLDSRNQPVELPFLEIAEELWNPEQRRLTLLIDPGRIKRGVRPLEDIGPAIESGKRYRLMVSEKWRDGRGVPMKVNHGKSFRVGPPDRSSPNPLEWHLTRPDAGTREPLVIRFPESLDHALASRVIWIEDSARKEVPGVVTLEKDETHWLLKPDAPWKPGRYFLRAELILEDLAGNSIGRPFEVDVFNRVDDGVKELPFRRAFTIGR